MHASAAQSSRIAGRFVLESIAGSGGMGTVYRARDEETGQTVAVKLIKSTDRSHENERFIREAELLAKLRHPSIVGYLAHGVTEAGEPYLAMEWLEGEDLSQRLARGELSLSESLVLLRRVTEALALAHEHRVVHRDLKPSNLFLRAGQVEHVALLDFGIARLTALSHVMTRTGMVVGTPGYMAPEQARGERDVTSAADVFSLGCIIFECLTGQAPFAADHLMAVLARICFDEPPKLRQMRPEMPEAVEALLGRMLAKSPSERLPDAAAVLAALDALDEVRPLAAPLTPSAGGELHLLSVLMATPPAGAYAAQGSPESTIEDEQFVELHRKIADFGAQVEILADGSLVATLRHARGAATDQAARAAQCALLIKARWPGATIAVGTGRGLSDERVAAGEVFDRAAALVHDHTAAPLSEQILIDDVTRGLLEVRFVVHKTPSGVYALTGEEVALDASRPLLGKPTPCVGRDVELGTLENALRGCIEDGEPRAVLVTAPPGAGKSRLRHEFLRRITARGEDLLVLIGRGDPMSAGSSYSLLGQAVRRLCGILDGESLEVRRAKLAPRIGTRIPTEERERVVSFIGEVAGVPFADADNVKLRAARQDPLLMNDQITQAMLDFLRAECAERPVLLVLEDLHWGDALTVKLCDVTLRKLKDCPLMVLALARPEVDELFPRLWSGAAQVVPLRPLGKKAGERLVQQVLGKQVTPETVARIVEQSEGNALFLEELIRAVAEGKGDEAPETVLAMLQARIGRLEAGARRVLRAASVFGETSWLGGIRALLGGSMSDEELGSWLLRLMQDEILEQPRESRFPGEQEHRFRHALMRDAAYGMLAEEDRVASHLLAGEYLEAHGEPDALVLAEHFRQGRDAERAIHYYVQAAEQSYEAYDMDATLTSAERGLACGAEGEQRGVLLSLQIATYLGCERYAEIIALGTDALDLLPEGSKRWCRAARQLFPAAALSQRVALLLELCSRFARVEPSAEARGEYVQAATWVSIMLAMTGMKGASRAFLVRVRQISAALDQSDVVSWGFIWAAEGFDHDWIEEAPWSAMLCYTKGRDACRTVGDQRYDSILSAHRGKALMNLGAYAKAHAEMRENLAISERLSETVTVVIAKAYLARLLTFTAPLAELDEPDRLARDIIAARNIALVGWTHGVVAEIKRRQGDLLGAEAEARMACDAARPFPPNSWDLIALRMRILFDLGRNAEALQIGEEAVQHMERLGLASSGELALRLALAEARHASGQIDAARSTLADILPRLKKRLDDIPELAARERYLTQVPTNARLVALAKEWLGLDVRA